MKKVIISIAALGLAAMQGSAFAGDPAEMAELCTDCHEIADFEGMSVEDMTAAFAEAKEGNKKKAKAVADLSDEDVAAIIAYVAAEANK